MSTIDIRKHYKQWLIEQGLKVKTPKGHASTVTEYLRRVDSICDRIYKRHTVSAWNNLATYILQKGAKINDVGKDGISALMCVALNPNPNIMYILIDEGANTKHRDIYGKNVIDYVRRNPNIYRGIIKQIK